LLRLPVPGNNVAKQTEPSKADPPKRKRRWFQFSLRTLMIVVTSVSVECAVCLPMLREWEANRQLDDAMRSYKESHGWPVPDN
jgi:hypothetical protein